MFESLYTADEMRSVEAGHDVEKLMQRAGRGLADFILDEYEDRKAITVVCGPGNNGGDGRVAARRLRQAQRKVRVVESKPEDEEKDLGRTDLLVDALFGTGFTGDPPPRGSSSRSTRRTSTSSPSTFRPGSTPRRERSPGPSSTPPGR